LKKKKIFINTVPHSGTHFLSSLLENIGYEHAIYRNTFYFRTPYYRRDQRAGINWRSAYLFKEKLKFFEKKTIPVSVSSPVNISESTYKDLFKVLCPGKFIIGHVPYSEQTEKVHSSAIDLSLTIIRDPRDMILSMLRHIKERPHHHAFDYLFNNLDNDSERFFAVAEGYDNFQGRLIGVDHMINSMLNWQVSDTNLCIKFEDIVGPSGGGSLISQLKTLETILTFIGLSSSKSDLEMLALNTFGKSSTFRKGQAYGWKQVLKEDENKIFEEKYSLILEKMGYKTP
tara:strand:+ start:9135 stop:9992 length:858 start_codon:yes stop_codon:yes gene_type:complete